MSSLSNPASHLLEVAAPLLALADAVAIQASSPGPPDQLLHLDCSALPYQRTLGVCHQVSQLLQLRQAGASIWLYRVHPVLRRCLCQLQLAHLFSWAT